MNPRLLVSTVCALTLSIAAPIIADDGLETFIARYISLAVQGDLAAAQALFRDSRWADEPAVINLNEQFRERFLVSVNHGEAPFADAVVAAYRNYWNASLFDPSESTAQETILRARIDELLDEGFPVPATPDLDTFQHLQRALRDQGLYVLESPAPPLRDLFVWRNETSRPYQVKLSDTRVEVDVRFIDDFMLQGWKDHASLGLASTTGWVDDGVLYCLSWAYDTTSENFDVSFLKHEARHLVDLERFPDMTTEELEYRAKLTELVHASRSMERLLNDFTDKAALNPDSAHAMANWRVIRDIYWLLNDEEMPEHFEPWNRVDVGSVNRAARELLQASTKRHSG
jgi:hypothetical protein